MINQRDEIILGIILAKMINWQDIGVLVVLVVAMGCRCIRSVVYQMKQQQKDTTNTTVIST